LDRQKLQKRIDDYLKSHVDMIESGRERGPDTPDVFPLLQMSVGRVLTNIGVKLDSEIKAIMQCALSETTHIYDWLMASKLREEAWLSRCDNKGRPLKLMKFSTIQHITAEANKAMTKRRNDGFRVPPTSGTEVVHECGDGWTILRLKTVEALDHEGFTMGHCVGNGAYDSSLSSNFTGIYSLRDPFGRSHVTLEINHSIDKVNQIKGKQNRLPKAEYMRRMIGWRGLKDVSVEGTELPFGFGIEKSRGIVELSSLKEGDVFEGNIGIKLEDTADFLLDIPSGVTIRGNVFVEGQRSHRLVADDHSVQMRWARLTMPDNVFFNGVVRLDRVTLERLSFRGRHLIIRNADVEGLGHIKCDVTQFAACNFTRNALHGTAFQGSVEMQDCRGAVFLKHTTVGAQVSIVGCRSHPNYDHPELEFADGFEAQRKLFILDSRVRLGDTILVNGDMDILSSSMTTMPSNLSVTGCFNIKDSQIDRWPETLDVGGSLNESGVHLSSLPTQTGPMRRLL
jgi:hypothetical protein